MPASSGTWHADGTDADRHRISSKDRQLAGMAWNAHRSWHVSWLSSTQSTCLGWAEPDFIADSLFDFRTQHFGGVRVAQHREDCGSGS